MRHRSIASKFLLDLSFLDLCHPALSLLAVALCVTFAQAQQTPPAKQPRNKYGSPLDTLMSTRLWTDVPPAKDFVRQSRPDPKTLDYTPLTGEEPDRPKARDKANVAALQAELERDRQQNERLGHGPRPAAKQKRAKSTGGE